MSEEENDLQSCSASNSQLFSSLHPLFRSSPVLTPHPPRHTDATAVRAALLSSRESVNDPSSPSLIPPLIHLAQSHLSQGDAALAEPLLQRALALARAALPPGHPQLAVPLERIALCHLALDRYSSAERYAKEHLAILEAQQSSNGLATSEWWGNGRERGGKGEGM